MQNARLAPLTIAFHTELSDTGTYSAFTAPCTCELVAVYIAGSTSPADINATTDYVAVEILDGGALGTGTALIASRGPLTTTSATAAAMYGLNWTALTKYTILAETSAPYQLDGGDKVNVRYTETGTIALGHLAVTFHVVPGTAN
jgi:hypothetical protein